jgi:hypothetical protein
MLPEAKAEDAGEAAVRDDDVQQPGLGLLPYPAWAKPPPPDRVPRPGGQPGVLELEVPPHRHGQGARGLAIGMMYDN